MHNPKPHHRFLFAPAAQFEVMMERGHLEDAPAEQMAAEDLDGDTAELHEENETK